MDAMFTGVLPWLVSVRSWSAPRMVKLSAEVRVTGPVPGGGISWICQFDGAEVRVGWKGGVGGTSAKRAEVLRVGSRMMLSSAVMVLVGAGLGGMVAREKSWPQREPSPAAPPGGLIQAEML
jgi:hypothetical protein